MTSSDHNTKVAIVLDASMPAGLAANTAAVTATEEAITYLGVALYGPRKQVQKLTGSLALLR
jgi:hypothetical protein